MTLSFCTQWPVGPVYVKTYWPPKKVLMSRPVLESTDNACSTSFLFIDELRSMLAVLRTQ